MTEETYIVESGVAFPDDNTAEVSVEATFIESGNQMQVALIGSEPVLLIQPEYHADTDSAKFILTAVDLTPAALLTVLKYLVDATEEMIAHAEEEERLNAASSAIDAGNAGL